MFIIFKSRGVKIAAIILGVTLPVVAVLLFLQSVWNPFGHTSKLPIAVVNRDQAVKYQGKKMAVGQQMIAQLKKNHGMQWHFVSAQKAQEGLKENKYYAVVEIPENFSKNATTVTAKSPKKMNLTYKTNDSMNYIAGVMSSVAVDQVNTQVRSAVTKSYALALFSQIKTSGAGFQKAADGATQLKDGTVTLQSGMKQYTTGVKTLKNGMVQLDTSVQPLPDGVKKLATGGQQLSAGLNQLNAKKYDVSKWCQSISRWF